MNEPIDASNFTRVESVSRLNFGRVWDRPATPELGTHKTTRVVWAPLQ